ncbi:hypothetical protein V8B97DRAFT_2021461 [Scleroderma yunnanense]
MGFCVLLVWAFLVLVLFSPAQAYTPAQPTNVSSQGLGGTNSNKLTLQWYPNGSDTEYVYYLLAGGTTNGISQVRSLATYAVFMMDEGHGMDRESLCTSPKISPATKPVCVMLTRHPLNPTQSILPFSISAATTPWIAFISCDGNSTNASQELDIFTLARDRGAQAALLYSLSSNSCAINPAYTDPDNGFDQVFDIYAIQALRVSKFIEYEFTQFGSNGTYYSTYNATMLNKTASAVNKTIASASPVAPGLLFATFQAFNATTILSILSSTDLMISFFRIILYAITGCVSALFCLVIISGAIRAIRHPERYGPRMPDHGGVGNPGQSRARGLGRAILDTFPVVKFGSSDQASEVRRSKDVEAPNPETAVTPTAPPSNSVELEQVRSRLGGSYEERGIATEDAAGPVPTWETTPTPRPRITTKSINQPPKSNDSVMPEAIGRETCPICIVDFEEGDDLRVLPCEGKHRFHQTCVDPWLLELSGSCPLCRQDFHALETMLSGDSQSRQSAALQRTSQAFSSGGVQNRFSRYLRFARGRQNREARGSAGIGSGGMTDSTQVTVLPS